MPTLGQETIGILFLVALALAVTLFGWWGLLAFAVVCVVFAYLYRASQRDQHDARERQHDS